MLNARYRFDQACSESKNVYKHFFQGVDLAIEDQDYGMADEIVDYLKGLGIKAMERELQIISKKGIHNQRILESFHQSVGCGFSVPWRPIILLAAADSQVLARAGKKNPKNKRADNYTFL